MLENIERIKGPAAIVRRQNHGMATRFEHRSRDHQVVGQPEAFNSHSRIEIRNGVALATFALGKADGVIRIAENRPAAPEKPANLNQRAGIGRSAAACPALRPGFLRRLCLTDALTKAGTSD